jgi:hypothetical protein
MKAKKGGVESVVEASSPCVRFRGRVEGALGRLVSDWRLDAEDDEGFQAFLDMCRLRVGIALKAGRIGAIEEEIAFLVATGAAYAYLELCRENGIMIELEDIKPAVAVEEMFGPAKA